jgi:hypothetical protein
MPPVTPRKVREAVAEELRDGMTRAKIEAFCREDLQLLLLDRQDGITVGDLAAFSKFHFVETLLQGRSLVELLDIATRVADELNSERLHALVSQAQVTGVAGELKNLIFAADGPKPKIVFRDAINNDITVVENEHHCLIYDRPLGPGGLTWHDLTQWWSAREGLNNHEERQIWISLYERLKKSLANEAEERILRAYVQHYKTLGDNIPALIPQVYLHYDPYARHSNHARKPTLARQRMDFLLLLPNRIRIVIECDGVQHYADDDGKANTHRYAEMVAEDRQLRLRGYEVYRFGGQELRDGPASQKLLRTFFDDLAIRHNQGSS